MSSFYKMFSAYYNTIFPLAGGKEVFFKKLLTNHRPRTALDLGCATGELTAFLTINGCETTGVDLSPDLLAQAHNKPGHFIKADMVDYLETEPKQKNDLIVCIGNTLPHLEPAKLNRFFAAVPTWLSDNGLLAIQTVNYQKILSGKPPGLPTIERPDAGVKFTRLYRYNPDGSIAFTGILDSPEGRGEATATLWPYTASDLKQGLTEAFRIEAEYGGFSDTTFCPESPAWILLAQKRQ